MPTARIDGNDPEASYAALKKAMDYVRTRAQAVPARGDGLAPLRPLVGERREPREGRGRLPRAFEQRLEERKLADARADGRAARDATRRSSLEAAKRCATSRSRRRESIWDYVFARQELTCGGEG